MVGLGQWLVQPAAAGNRRQQRQPGFTLDIRRSPQAPIEVLKDKRQEEADDEPYDAAEHGVANRLR